VIIVIKGVPKEIKNNENRIALTPEGAKKLVDDGHTVMVEESGGVGSGFPDNDYKKAGASIKNVDEVWNASLILKIKEPLEKEYDYFKKDQVIFTYLHLAGVTKTLTKALVKSKCIAVAYETVEDKNGRLPLLKPMSEVAGRMSVQVGAQFLAKYNGGRGIMLEGIDSVRPGEVVIIGDGVVGINALQMAYGRKASIILFGRSEEKLKRIEKDYPGIKTLISTPENVEKAVVEADLVVGGVLIHGGKAPYIVTEDLVKKMKQGSVIVDVSIDQGGCVETSEPTSHSKPVVVKHGVIHYAVTNMPGAYPRTSTFGITNATFPYIAKLAKYSVEELAKQDPGFAKGINAYKGKITYKAVAEPLDMMDDYEDLEKVM